MILQKLLMPTLNICNESKMYFSSKKRVKTDNSYIIEKEDVIDFDTYMNSFSIAKWKKYTVIDKLQLQIDLSGKCEIFLCYAWIDNENIIRRNGDNIPFYKKEKTEREKLTLDFQHCPVGVVAYFRIKTEEETTIFSASYNTNIDYKTLPEVKVAIGICTYKREQYVSRNIERIYNRIINNESSMLHNNLYVFISDNGNTLDKNAIESQYIRLKYNLNLGGSGGFTRTMIEAKRSEKELGLTHIIMTDDDIILDTNVLEKNFVLLKLLKPEYRMSMIGGSMLIMDTKWKQFENAAYYSSGQLKFYNKNTDMRTIRNIINNETEHDVNYNAWCYCCMPLKTIKLDNLPLPIFIHMDDVEYGVRSKLKVITMNGICVWHPFMANQRNSSIVYYDVRNKLIVMSEFGGKHITEYAIQWLEIFYKSIFNYNYNCTLAACKGIQDFCNGIDYFKNIDALKLNEKLRQYNYTWKPVSNNLLEKIDNSNSKDYFSRKGLLLNYLLPSKRKEIVMDCSISDAMPYRAQKLIIVNRSTGKFCVYKKSFAKMLKCKIECRKTKKLIKKKIVHANWEWFERMNEITNIEFWDKYLKIDEESK